MKIPIVFNGFNSGYTLIEMIVSITVFTVFFTMIYFGFSSIIKMEIKAKKNVIESFDKTNKTIDEFLFREKESF